MVKLYESGRRAPSAGRRRPGKLIEVKTAADEAHRAHIAAIEEVRDYREDALRGPRRTCPLQLGRRTDQSEEDFLARLKKGEKVSTADLLELQKTGRG